MHKQPYHFRHQTCQTSVGQLRAISDSDKLTHLDWGQIGWKDPDCPNDVSRETINQLIAYLAG